MVVQQLHLVDVTMQKAPHQVLCQGGSFLIGRFIRHMLEIAFGLESQFLHTFRYLPAYRVQKHVLHTQGLVFIQNNRQMPDDICIEPATQTGIGGKHDDSHTLHFTFHNERRLHLTIRTQKIGQDVIQPSFVRKHVFYGSLRLMQLGRGYHLHSRSNFPRIIY